MWMKITVLMTLTLGVAACNLGGGAGQDIDARLEELQGSGGEERVTELVGDGWDKAALFSEGATAEEVQEVLGVDAFGGERYTDSRTVLVLVDGDDSRLVKFSSQGFDGSAYATEVGPDAVFVAPKGGGLVTLR